MMANQIRNEHNLRNVLGKFKFDLRKNLFLGKIPKLEFIALNKITIDLWHDQLGRVDRSLLCDNCVWHKMRNCQKEILKKIPHLIIPEDCKVPLKLRISSFLNVLGKFLVHFNHFEYLSFDNFNNYWDNICFTQQGTINYVKTASQLIDNTSLSTEEKFVLACKNSFEEKIRALLNLLPEDIIEKYNNTDDCLKMYWICCMKGELDRFYTFEQGYDYWDHLIVSSICKQYQVTVQHFWGKNFKEKMHRLTANLENNKNIYICLYLFQQMNDNDLLNLKVGTIKVLLKKLKIISQQDVVPPVETYILDLIIKYNVFDAFEILLFCRHNEIIRDYDYRTLWAELAIYFRDDIEENFIEFSTQILSSCMLERNDILSFKLLLRNCSPVNNKKILDGKNGIKYCVALINIGGFVLLDKYLNYILEKEELISEWKKYIFDEGILELCVQLIIYGKFQLINTFLKNYVPEDQMCDFKKNLPFKNNADFIRCFSELYEFYAFDFLVALKNFLFWCFKGNEEEIERFKSLVFDVDGDYLYSDKREIFFTILKELTMECKWELVEKYVKWIYFVPKDIDGTPFEKLARIKKILRLIFIREPNDLCRDRFIAYTKLLKKLITWCFEQNEVEKLKEELDGDNYLMNLVSILMGFSKHIICDDLLFWCFSSNDVKINDFKRSFMLSRGCNDLFIFIENSCNTYKVKPLLKWFNPSLESMILFRDRFITFATKHKLFMLHIFCNIYGTNDEFKEYMASRNKGVEKCLKIMEEILCSKAH